MAGAALLLVIGAALWLLMPHLPSADSLSSLLRSGHEDARAWHRRDPLAAVCAFCLAFGLMSALAMPGCSVLALGAGAVFGAWWGTLLVAVMSAAGATLSFGLARHVLRDRVRTRLGARLAAVDAGLKQDGHLYLFSLRLAPVIPYALVNPLMGLSSMSAWSFFWVSALGMLAGSALYATAGAGLADWSLGSASGVPAWQVAAGLTALALLPWVGRWCIRSWRRRGSRSP